MADSLALALNGLELNNLTTEWVTETWASLLEDIELPDKVLAINNLAKKLLKLEKVLRTVDTPEAISPQLLSLIGGIVGTFDENLDENDYKVLIAAIAVYFRLLAIPRSAAYGAAHPILLEKSLIVRINS